MKNYILLILFVTLLFSCKESEKPTGNSNTTKKETTKDLKKSSLTVKETLFISMERTPCFGKCPSYKIFIFNTGNVIYEGYANTDKIGKFGKQLTKKQLSEIKRVMDEIEIIEFKDVYDSPATDYPSTILYMLIREQHKKKILDRVDGPPELKRFEKLIDFLVLDDELIQLPTNK